MHSWWKAGISGFEQRQNFKAIYIGREKLSVEGNLSSLVCGVLITYISVWKQLPYYNRTATL